MLHLELGQPRPCTWVQQSHPDVGRTLCAIKEWTLAKLCPWTCKHLHLLTCLREFSRSRCPGTSQAWRSDGGFLQTLTDSSEQQDAIHILEKPFSRPADQPHMMSLPFLPKGTGVRASLCDQNHCQATGSSELPTPQPGFLHSHLCVLLTQVSIF